MGTAAGLSWEADRPIDLTFSILGAYQQFGWTGSAIADVTYYDPFAQRRVTRAYPVGGNGASSITVTTGVPVGSRKSVGEVVVSVRTPNITGAGSAGRLVGNALGALSEGLSGTAGLRANAGYYVQYRSIRHTERDISQYSRQSNPKNNFQAGGLGRYMSANR